MNDLDLTFRPVLVPRARLQTDPVSGDPVLLYPEGILVLNSSAQDVIARCNGQHSVQDLLVQLGAEYEESAESLQTDVLAILRELHGRNLITYRR